MAGEAVVEPTAEKLKQDFSIKEQDLIDLKLGLNSCVWIPCRCLQFTAANAANKYQSYSFCQAYCDTIVGEDQKTKRKEEYAFGSFFDDGLELLQNFTKDPTEFQESRPVGPRQTDVLLLQRLLDFLRNEENRRLIYRVLTKCSMSESTTVPAIANHLLSNLSLNSSFTVDKRFSGKPDQTEREKCRCGCCEVLKGYYGETGYGHPEVWHGNTDILANGQSVAVSNMNAKDQGDGKDSHGRSSVKVKKSVDKNSKQAFDQLIAQSVCFSFLQNSRHPEFINKLVPAIGIYKSQVVILMYDTCTDTLVQSAAIELLDTTKETIRMHGLIALWLVLNYTSFSSFSQSAADFVSTLPKANFFSMAGQKVNIYKEQLKFGNMARDSLTKDCVYRIASVDQMKNLKLSDKMKSLGF